MNASAALLSGPFVAGTVKTCERSLGQKGHRPLGGHRGDSRHKLCNRELSPLPRQSDLG
jgi:hypothetical protein